MSVERSSEIPQEEMSIRKVFEQVRDDHGVVFFYTIEGMLIDQAKRIGSERQLTTPDIFGPLARYDSEMADLLSRAEFPHNAMYDYADSRPVKEVDPLRHISMVEKMIAFNEGAHPSDDLVRVMNSAGKIIVGRDSQVVMPHHLLYAALDSAELSEALKDEDGAMDRLRIEVDLFKGARLLSDVSELLVDPQISREERVAILGPILDAIPSQLKPQ